MHRTPRTVSKDAVSMHKTSRFTKRSPRRRVLASGGDKVDLEVSLDDLGCLESIDDDNADDEEEKPLTGPLPGLCKSFQPPPLSVWFTVACVGLCLLVLSTWPFLMYSRSKSVQNLSVEGGNKPHAESEVRYFLY